MITPTVGRVVLFWAKPPSEQGQPFAATVAYVHGDRAVNLSYVDHNGQQHAATSVQLVQPEDLTSNESYYCEWMPYQKGQATKTEAAEKTAAELGAEVRRAGLAGN